MDDSIRFPIGHYTFPGDFSDAEVTALIDRFSETPTLLRKAVEGLDDAALDTRYREGGWTLRQVVHHIADSHMNGYIRFRWTLSEGHPTIKPYEQDGWAALSDAMNAPIESSLMLYEGMVGRWVALMRNMTHEQWRQTYHHPQDDRDYSLLYALGLYEWHSHHHIAHITSARERFNF